MKNEQKQTGKVNYFRVLIGGYLIYLAYKLFRGAIAGEAGFPVIGVLSGILFVAVGGWVLWLEWKAYKYAAAHVDDPESWNDDPEILAEILKEEEAKREEEALRESMDEEE